MNKLMNVLISPLVISTVIISGCTQQAAPPPATPPVVSEPEVKTPSKKEIFDLLTQAGELDRQFSAKTTHTTEEAYAHYDSHFTRGYVDQIVFQGGNWKKEGNQWVLAVEGGEYIEGTYFHTDFHEDAEMVVSEDKKRITITHSIGDGLYAPHDEIITLLHTEKTWKVDNVTWEYLHSKN